MKSKYLSLMLSFVFGIIVSWLFLYKGFYPVYNTNYIIKQDLTLSNKIKIVKGTIVQKVKELPEGCSIYALYFKSWSGYEKHIVIQDSLNKNFLKSYLLDEDLILKNE